MTHYLVGDVAYSDKNPVAVEKGRPVVVIDPEDLSAVARLYAAYVKAAPVIDNNYVPEMQAALRELATPPKQQVFRHFIAKSDGGIKVAECGKVWRLNAEANVINMGDCETCADIVGMRWSV